MLGLALSGDSDCPAEHPTEQFDPVIDLPNRSSLLPVAAFAKSWQFCAAHGLCCYVHYPLSTHSEQFPSARLSTVAIQNPNPRQSLRLLLADDHAYESGAGQPKIAQVVVQGLLFERDIRPEILQILRLSLR